MHHRVPCPEPEPRLSQERRDADPAPRRRRWTGGARVSTRLLLIIATCLLPLVGLQVAVGLAQWSERKAQLDDLATHQARLLKGNADSIAEGARILLAAAAIPQLRGSGDECGGRLAKLREGAPGFAFVAHSS